MRYKAILFDLDGTLVDTLADLTEAMNYALRQMGLPIHTAAACRTGGSDGAAADPDDRIL